MKRKKTQKIARVLFVAVAVLAVGGVSALGWQWYRSVPLRAVEVVGHQYAPADTLVRLAGVASDSALYDIDPLLIEDRVRRHPWVHTAEAVRLPTGTLRLRVHERTPVALALDGSGRPAYLLDATGAMMPRPDSGAFNVPLLHGLGGTYHPVRPVEQADVRSLLEALGGLDPAVSALVSDIEFRDGEAWLRTTPLAGRGAITVRLGRGGYARKFVNLHAFWHRAMLPKADTEFTLVDLRFDSQIVTRESTDRP